MQFKQFLILVSVLFLFGVSWSACGGETSTAEAEEKISSTIAAASTAPAPVNDVEEKQTATKKAEAEKKRLAEELEATKEEAKKEEAEAAKKKAKKKPKKRAKMVFPEKVFDYGFIMQGDEVKHDFYFKNVGNDDLVITRVEPSCGCTVPVYPREPIPPGEDGKISVTFKSAGKLGRQVPNIQVYTNYKRKIKLELKGFVDAERAKPPQVTEVIKDSIQ